MLLNMNVKNQSNKKGATTSAPEVTSFYTTSNINYNTYLMLTPLFKALIVSTNNNGKYNLKVIDNKNGFYFWYHELNLSIKVPLSAIFGTNDKLKGILAIKWASAIECPSRRRGLCQLKDTNKCYAVVGELQGSKKAPNYLLGMGSYLNSLLCINYWNQFYNSPEVRKNFFNYCLFYGVDTLRFNLSGDFKSLKDVKILDILASHGLKLTGYTARDDLRRSLLKVMNKHDNIILNGSNQMYTNYFKATDNIYKYFTAPLYCRGGCLKNGCLNCYKLKNKIITVLIHGSRVGTDLNTPINRTFISWALKLNGYNVAPEELKKSKDLFYNLKKVIPFDTVPLQFKKLNKNGELIWGGHSSLINFIYYCIVKNGFKPEAFINSAEASGFSPEAIKGEL